MPSHLVAKLVQIPWWHNVAIISKCKDVTKALYYVNQTIEHNWSRNVLIHQMEREALELRRRKYASQLAKIDRSVLSAAAEGDIAAARLAYQRFEGWSEKRLQEHSGKDGKPIDHSMTMDEMAARNYSLR